MKNGAFFRVPESPADVEWLWRRATPLDAATLPDWARDAPADSYRRIRPLDPPRADEQDDKAYAADLEQLHAAGLIIGSDMDEARRYRVYAAAPRRWSIGIYTGDSPLRLGPAGPIKNPVLTHEDVTDVMAAYLADPFMIHANHTWFLFCEVMNWRANKGEIGLATSHDSCTWTYQQIVLAESFHLSYPYVFEWNGAQYLVPESHQAGAVRLYKADRFPTQWTFVATLLEGRYFADSSLLHHDGKWWLFTETNPQRRHDTLELYYADDLLGPWHRHPASPIVAGNARTSRPAGRVVANHGRVIRFAQSCLPEYGTDVRAFEVLRLDTSGYEEREAQESPILTPSGTGWNAHGMHHVDAHRSPDGRWIAAVDGWARCG
jgi:hypothetical protein